MTKLTLLKSKGQNGFVYRLTGQNMSRLSGIKLPFDSCWTSTLPSTPRFFLRRWLRGINCTGECPAPRKCQTFTSVGSNSPPKLRTVKARSSPLSHALCYLIRKSVQTKLYISEMTIIENTLVAFFIKPDIRLKITINQVTKYFSTNSWRL